MRRADFTAEARREYLLQVAFYERAEPGLGAQFVLQFDAAIARALAFPSSGRPEAAGHRRLIVRQFPFSIAYLATEQGITIVAVVHHARAPDHWQDRIQDCAA